MTQEEKQLFIRDLCARLPYGVKILYEGWDSDHGCGYETVETLIGIDDRFVYTVWNGGRYKHSLSAASYKSYLRPISSMTEDEEREFEGTLQYTQYTLESYDWFNAHHFDYRDLIEKGLAIEAKPEIYKI